MYELGYRIVQNDDYDLRNLSANEVIFKILITF